MHSMNNNMSTVDLQNHNHLYDRNHMHHSTLMMMSMKSEEDDMDFHDNKSETSSRSGGGGGKSKVFQCTGYGECSMVFTRSEHLARHMRKHTGEKPFKCVVPGCERMFSRFDNMMQHTQTHNKSRGGNGNGNGNGGNGGSRRPKAKTKRGGGKKSSCSRRASSSDDYDEYALPSPPPSRRSSALNMMTEEHQIILPNPKYVELDEEDMTDEEHQEANKIISFHSHEKSARYPDSPASSSDSSSYDHYFFTQPIRRRRSAPRIHYQPYPYNELHHQEEIIPVLPRRNSALSQLATYLVNNPDQSPESYLLQQQQQQQGSSPPTLAMTRRLSMQDLSNPIEALDHVNHPIQEEEGIDLTEDEYQAIQGFGQFYRSAITCNK
ncbi:uncharacterized protein EV154DRAFT_551992 [Mucor mucedo]|uniref:uncharacterized protein n=1 Tax=Mucor mucedo TaxID=29922 RepID=UPI00221F6717|nr:uncharacterized protein EV154DRAFT_551992 [Mucor mucedo]KAI7890792.1 hypothetical protein EV154DRAFT_551992 [Mucor mucedo]